MDGQFDQNAAELARRAKEGDAQAFGTLYELYFTPVYRYLFFRVKDNEEAADLAQTVFIKVFQSIHRFEEQGKSPLAYLFTVARNTLIDHWRKKRPIILDEAEDIITKADAQQLKLGNTQAPEVDDRIEHIRNALSILSDDQQEVIIQKFFNDIPNSEIARQLGKSEVAVRQLQSRALKILRDHLHTASEDDHD